MFNNFGNSPCFSGSYNGYGMPYSTGGAWYPPSQYWHPYIYDQLPISGNSWLTPHMVIHNHISEVCKEFQTRRLSKSGSGYYVRERNDREVFVGELKVKDKLIVNPRSDGTFDALYCTVEYNGKTDPVQIVIPYKEFIKRNFLHCLSGFQRNPDCPDKYITMAFCQELLEGDDTKFLTLPSRSGWAECGDKATFASDKIVIPQLKSYYAADILERKLVHTELKFADAADHLKKHLPQFWQYKLLLVIRITSLLLFFYAEAGLQPDHMIIIEPQSESNAKAGIALLKNKNCSSIAVRSLTDCRTALQHELDLINDGIVVFRDTSYVEDLKRRSAGLEVLLQDLGCRNGNEDASRHLIAVVTDNPGALSTELPAYFLSLDECADIQDIHGLQQAAGAFECALVDLLSNSDRHENLVTCALEKTAYLNKTISNSEYYMTQRMLRTTIEILYSYHLISSEERSKMIQFLKGSHYKGMDSNQKISNEFRKVLSDAVEHGHIGAVNQIGPPFFDPSKRMVFVDAEHINLMAAALDNCILPLMKTTQKRNKLLQALKACGKLYANNNFKRNVDVETAPGVTETVSVYSFPKEILTPKSMVKVNALAHADYLFRASDFPDGFVPIVSMDDDKAAGRVLDDATDEAESIYVSGRTRSGKTHFLVQQAVIRAKAGSRIIIFDQTGAFSREELAKHLPRNLVQEVFSHWEISKEGLPVDLLSLENCSSLVEKKNRLFGIFSIAANITGEVQGKVLRKCLTKISKEIDEGKVHDLPSTLRLFDEKNPDQAEIKARLEEVFDDLEGLKMYCQSWGDFLDSKAKITVISTSADGIRKSSQLVDMMLSSLYAYKQYQRNARWTVILDEIEDLCLEKDGPISTILRKGGKHGLSMLLASQEFSVDKDKLGKLIGNCGILAFFRPKDADIGIVSKHIGFDRAVLAGLEQGELVAVGGFRSRSRGKNCTVKLMGRSCLCENC